MKEKLDLYIKENLYNKKFNNKKLFGKSKKAQFNEESEIELCENHENILDYCIGKTYSEQSMASVSNIQKYIDENENNYNNFQSLLFEMIDKRNLKDTDVYNKVHIDRRLFSKIRSDKKYHPSKETILLLGFSLELSENEIEKLLESASYSLPKNNHYDLIIRFCFINKIYKLTDINSLLESYGCKLFNY